MGALSDMVRQGKALYVGISNYQAEEAERAIAILKENGTPCLIHQARYNMFERWPEQGLFEVLTKKWNRLYRLQSAGPGRADR